MPENAVRICRVVTVPFILVHHLRSQLKATREAGYDLTIVASPGLELAELARELDVRAHAITIRRNMSPVSDLRSMIALYRYFRKEKFDIVHSITPKAALLCAIAGYLAGTRIRLHTFTGQPWATLSGPVRWLTKASDWLVVRLNTQCYADSRSQADYLVAEGIGRAGEVAVLGAGCLGGVDVERFDPDRWRKQAAAIRSQLNIPADSPIVTYVGRVTNDKGITELVGAQRQLAASGVDVYFLLVGPFEPERDPLPANIIGYLQQSERIKVIGYSLEPERYLAISDILCIPSYREGFGNVVIEAAAMGVPAVATRIVGLVDAVEEGVTGILVPPRDADALAVALSDLLRNPLHRQQMGEAARASAKRLFDAAVVNRLVLDEYARLEKLCLKGS